ncbi:MAG: SDR family oxidoreductase [Gammaproteobacteria bacterium]|nr:MAG: SDR family oxidoreductase [Gammaproteobacteria bacterium]
MGILSGKKILITGIASERSISAGIADSMYEQGAELAFTYMNDKLKGRVEKVAARCGSDIVLPLDVASDEQIKDCFAELTKKWEKFDGFVHAIAFAPPGQLDGDYLDAVTREGFQISHDISSYSFAAMAKEARPYLNPKASLTTLSYLGAVAAISNYNVMGLAKASLEANVRYMANALGKEDIRVNAISAGPIRTLAASGISNFKKMLALFEMSAPLKRCVTIKEVGDLASVLASDLSASLTGQILYADNGFSISALPDATLDLVK